jgi:hypothetical protein
MITINSTVFSLAFLEIKKKKKSVIHFYCSFLGLVELQTIKEGMTHRNKGIRHRNLKKCKNYRS